MKVWNYLFQGLGLVNSSNMQNEIGCLFKVLLNVLQGILLMHDMVWDRALPEQHPVYTYLRPTLSASTMSMSQATKLVILCSVFPQNDNDLMTAHERDIITSPFEIIYKLRRQSFLSPGYIYTHTQIYKISGFVNLCFWTELELNLKFKSSLSNFRTEMSYWRIGTKVTF